MVKEGVAAELAMQHTPADQAVRLCGFWLNWLHSGAQIQLKSTPQSCST